MNKDVFQIISGFLHPINDRLRCCLVCSAWKDWTYLNMDPSVQNNFAIKQSLKTGNIAAIKMLQKDKRVGPYYYPEEIEFLKLTPLDEKLYKELKRRVRGGIPSPYQQMITTITEMLDEGNDYFEIRMEKFDREPGFRILAHIVGCMLGLYTRKKMSLIHLSDFYVMCKKHHILWIENTPRLRYLEETACCMLHGGYCPMCGWKRRDDVAFKASGKERIFIGVMEFSKNHLKLGRRKRKQRNRRKYLDISFF